MQGIIFICDECLDELKISIGDFDTFNISEMVESSEEAKLWLIPDLVDFSKEDRRYFEITASNVICVCPKCKHLYEEVDNDQ